ncbi:MAG: hypothetical protein II937_14155 [Bacteroidales bacterium]|nr:hypothetical protein [Bacteroidales bacterium]
MCETLNFRFESISEFSSPIFSHSFILRCIPFENLGQRLLECNQEITGGKISRSFDGFSNTILWGGIDEAHENFRVVSQGRVLIDNSFKDTFLNPVFKFPSRLASADAVMKDFAQSYIGKTPGETLKNLTAAVYEKHVYKSNSTNIETTAAEAFYSGCGVCQDFSHILISALRADGIPARYVCGYVRSLKLSHAWVEAFYDGFWHFADPTENILQGSGYIKIAHGRDASDCPLNRGVYSGLAAENVKIEIRVE